MSVMIRATLVSLSATFLACTQSAGPSAGSKHTQMSALEGAGRADAGVVPDDGADAGEAVIAHCGTGACDLLDPAACPRGQGCVLAFTTQPAAEPQTQCIAVGDGGDGAACSSSADCQPGLDCTTAPDAGAGQCRRYCCELNRSRGCPSGQVCRIGIENGHGALTGVFVCDHCDDCDLRDATACGAGKGCYQLAGTKTCRVCLPSGGIKVGEPCTLNDDCEAGTGCLRAGPDSRCLLFCDLATSSSCSGGTSCRTAVGLSLPSGTGVCF
jgi:hypothetical protein